LDEIPHSLAPLNSDEFDSLFGLGVQLDQAHQSLCLDTHEEESLVCRVWFIVDSWDGISREDFHGAGNFLALIRVVALLVEQDLVVTEPRVTAIVCHWELCFGRADRHIAIHYEVDVSELVARLLHEVVRLKQTGEHADDKLIPETDLAVVEEKFELFSEVFEDCLNDIILHFGRYLLEEREFFDYQVEIVKHSVLHVLRDHAVQLAVQELRLVRSLDLLNPNVHILELFRD